MNQICRIVELRLDELTISNGEYQYDVLFQDVKLIARPLSDLTKEIEHNGEKFVPQDILDETHISHWSYVNIKYLDSKMLQDAPFWFTQKLIEWHFDVHGLIERKLAIDLNTLTND